MQNRFSPVQKHATDKDRYDSICAQIKREEDLNSFRYRMVVLVNIALGTAAVSQISGDEPRWQRLTIFALILGGSITFNLISALSINAGRTQLIYLKDEYFKEANRKFKGFARPFHWAKQGKNEVHNWLWSSACFILILLWIIAAVVGVQVICLQAGSGNLNG